MESPTSFDLDAAVQGWRRDLCSKGVVDAASADELESHLRDSMDSLRSAGLQVDEAFLVARKRLGPTESLQQEFGQLNPERLWIDRAQWMLAGVLAFGVVMPLGSTCASAVALAGVRWMPGQSMLGSAVLTAMVHVAVTLGVLALVARWVAGAGPQVLTRWQWWLSRPALVAVGVCLLQFVGTGVSLLMAPVSHLVLSPEAMARFHLSKNLAQYAAVALIMPTMVYLVLRRRSEARQAA